MRIIAGALKGRVLRVPPGRPVRPTPALVREALFDILGERVAGASVLDAYAGTGALGFEALSRGARSAVFVEADPVLARELRRAAQRLGVADRAHCLEGRVDVVLARRRPGPFDLVLADPPYTEAPQLLWRVAASLLAPGGLLVLQRDRHRAGALEPPEGLVRLDRREYGRTVLDFFGRES